MTAAAMVVANEMNMGAQVIKSSFLGEIPWEPGSELSLPVGLPGFEGERSLLPVEIPAHRPLVFLQSITRPDICLVCLPVSSIAPDYKLQISEDDLMLLDLDPESELRMGEDVLCLALLLPTGTTVRTNLDAPIVISLRTLRCSQLVPRCSSNGSRTLSPDGCWEVSC